MTGSASKPLVKISIVMPCLNEAETVGICVAKARSFLNDHNLTGEVIVADNGSTDGSQKLAMDAGARVVQIQERGYGSALSGGIEAARGSHIIMGDADDSYDFLALAPFVERLGEGFDLVMGNRFAGGIETGAMPPLHRYLGNPVLSGFGRIFFRSPVRDFHCGLRGFSRDAYQRMGVRTTGMEFASEMVAKASLLGMKIAEVPTTLAPAGRSRPPHLRSWRDGWRHLRFMLLYSPRWLFLYPGLLLIALGITIGAFLLPGPRTIGQISFDVYTLLYAAGAVIVGYQAVIFALFTKVFAMNEGLLPKTEFMERLFGHLKLESGLLLGGVLFLAGILLTAVAVGVWGRADFGELDARGISRITIPAMLLILLGCQTFFSSFFLSVLGLRRKGHEGQL